MKFVELGPFKGIPSMLERGSMKEFRHMKNKRKNVVGNEKIVGIGKGTF